VTTATTAGTRRGTLVDDKASSGTGLRVVADALGFPDKEEVGGYISDDVKLSLSFSIR
jgi:hypothetical protein